MKLPMITNPTGSIGTIAYLPTISPYKSAIHVGKWVFSKIGGPHNGRFIMEIPIKMDDLGGKPTIFGNTQIYVIVPWIVWVKEMPFWSEACEEPYFTLGRLQRRVRPTCAASFSEACVRKWATYELLGNFSFSEGFATYGSLYIRTTWSDFFSFKTYEGSMVYSSIQGLACWSEAHLSHHQTSALKKHVHKSNKENFNCENYLSCIGNPSFIKATNDKQFPPWSSHTEPNRTMSSVNPRIASQVLVALELGEPRENRWVGKNVGGGKRCVVGSIAVSWFP